MSERNSEWRPDTQHVCGIRTNNGIQQGVILSRHGDRFAVEVGRDTWVNVPVAQMRPQETDWVLISPEEAGSYRVEPTNVTSDWCPAVGDVVIISSSDSFEPVPGTIIDMAGDGQQYRLAPGGIRVVNTSGEVRYTVRTEKAVYGNVHIGRLRKLGSCDSFRGPTDQITVMGTPEAVEASLLGLPAPNPGSWVVTLPVSQRIRATITVVGHPYYGETVTVCASANGLWRCKRGRTWIEPDVPTTGLVRTWDEYPVNPAAEALLKQLEPLQTD